MDHKKIKAIVIGCGMVGAEVASILLDRGVDIVGAVDTNKYLLGKDIGDFLGKNPIGVAIENDAEKVMSNTKADIAIIAAVSLMEQLSPIIKQCLKNKLNVITSSEYAYYAPYTAPEIDEEIDLMAKENGVTVFASGMQEVFWTYLPIVLSGASYKINRINGSTCGLVDGYGHGIYETIFLGKSMLEFEAISEADKKDPFDSYPISLHAIADYYDLSIIEQTQSCLPIIAKRDMYVEDIDTIIAKGCIIGTNLVTTLQTEEGIIISSEFIRKLREEEYETEYNAWEIEGNPSINLRNDNIAGETVGASIVNRIPDVINASPGFKNILNMPMPRFYPHSLNTYIK